MGSDWTPAAPLLQDLKVRIQSRGLVFPSGETQKRSMFLSNIDQVLNFNVETVHFFAPNPDFDPQDHVTKNIKNALEKILVPYDFLAGRMKLNEATGRLEIDCNGAGAVFAVASSECRLDEIGDLVYPNPAFAQLVVLDKDNLGAEDKPLCNVQVTTFRCGGFAMGVSTSHATLDGISFKTFLDNLAALASDKPLAITPCNDRQLLAARSPPRVTFPHPELFKFNTHLGDHDQESAAATVFDTTQESLDFNIFHLTSNDVQNLKEKANNNKVGARISGFNVVIAHIWRCKALSLIQENQENQEHKDIDLDQNQENLERMSTILYAVNIRPKLIPPLPPSYAGNAVLTAYASAKCKELKEGPFSKLVEVVGEGAKRMSDEYAKSVIDWGEMHKGFPNGEFLVSSWWKLGFDEVDYPWGRPVYSCPVVYHRKDIILLFPDQNDKNGVSILVALPKKEMDKFKTLFFTFLKV